MRRKASNLAAVASLAVFVAAAILWVRSYRPQAIPSEVQRGGWVFLNFRGQLVLIHHHASPEPRKTAASPRGWLASLRGTWGTSTVLLSRDRDEVAALLKVLAMDPDAQWDAKTNLPDHLLTQRYFIVPVAHGCRFRNGGGFGFTAVYLPAIVPRAREIGSIFQTVAVPHWFVVLTTALLPMRWAWRRIAAGRRRRAGRCVRCGYDLRATPGRCPECGTAPAAR